MILLKCAMHMFLLFLIVLSPTLTLAFEEIQFFENNNSPIKVLVFLSRSCPCSKSHVDHLNKLNRDFEMVSLFGVITDDFDKSSEGEIEQYYSEKNFEFPLIKDEPQTLVKKYNALKTPHSVIVKRDANKSYQIVYQGGVTDNRTFSQSTKKFLAENLAALSQNKAPVYTAGKSLGCYIRRL